MMEHFLDLYTRMFDDDSFFLQIRNLLLYPIFDTHILFV